MFWRRRNKEDPRSDDPTHALRVALLGLQHADVPRVELALFDLLADFLQNEASQLDGPDAAILAVSQLQLALMAKGDVAIDGADAPLACGVSWYRQHVVAGARAFGARDRGVTELVTRLIATAEGELRGHGRDRDLCHARLWALFLLAVASGPGSGTGVPVRNLATGLQRGYQAWSSALGGSPAPVIDLGAEIVAPTTQQRGSEVPSTTKEAPSAPAIDIGPEVVNHVYRMMQIDAEWADRKPRAYTWWGHRLAQTIVAEPLDARHGAPAVRVHSTTHLLRNVPNTSRVTEVLAEINSGATLDTLVFSPREGTIRSFTAAWIREDNRWIERHLTLAVAHQVALAEARVDLLSELVGGEVAATSHGESGPRETPDQMLELLDEPTMGRPLEVTPRVFAEIAAMDQAPWPLVSLGADGLSAELAFDDAVPAGAREGRCGTALLTMTVGSSILHPDARARSRVGPGIHVDLRLPIEGDSGDLALLANELNQAEASGACPAHLLGAWYVEQATVGFTSYIASDVLTGLPPNQVAMVLGNYALGMDLRAKWAREWLEDRRSRFL